MTAAPEQKAPETPRIRATFPIINVTSHCCHRFRVSSLTWLLLITVSTAIPMRAAGNNVALETNEVQINQQEGDVNGPRPSEKICAACRVTEIVDQGPGPDVIPKETLDQYMIEEAKRMILQGLGLTSPPNVSDVPPEFSTGALEQIRQDYERIRLETEERERKEGDRGTKTLYQSLTPVTNRRRKKRDLNSDSGQIFGSICPPSKVGSNSACFTIAANSDVQNYDVTNVTLWLYKASTGGPVSLKIFEMITQTLTDPPKQIYAQVVTAPSEKTWFPVNIKSIFNTWNEEALSDVESLRRHLTIECLNCSESVQGGMASPSAGNSDIQTEGEMSDQTRSSPTGETFPISTGQNRPYIVIDVESKRLSRTRRGSHPTEHPCKLLGCCKVEHEIKFEDIGWGYWIYQPKSYWTASCQGYCTKGSPSIVGRMNHLKNYTTCCHPLHTTNVDMLYFVDREMKLASVPLKVNSCMC